MFFLVKSSYQSLTPLDMSTPSFNWIWKLPIPPKTSFFLWLLAHNRLPTAEYLSKLGITHYNICAICNAAPEIAKHTFLECTQATKLQAFFNLTRPLNCLASHHIDHRTWVSKLLHTPLHSPPHGIPTNILLSFFLWHLCHTRNKNTLEHKKLNIDIPMLVTKAAEHYFLKRNNKKKTPNTPLFIKWHPLHAPFYKLNIDGSASTTLYNYGTGGVFRDYQGHWVM